MFQCPQNSYVEILKTNVMYQEVVALGGDDIMNEINVLLKETLEFNPTPPSVVGEHEPSI